MGRAKTERVYRNFSKGLVTEASGLVFPENAMFAALNVELTKEGYAVKRRGIDLEASYVATAGPASYSSDNLIGYTWQGANDAGDDYAVVCIDYTMYIYSLSSGTPSSDLVDTVTLPFLCGGCHFSSINQTLVITKAGYYPVRYTEEHGLETQDLQVRDYKDATTDYETERPTFLTRAHEYDLYNRGWKDSAEMILVTGTGIATPMYPLYGMFITMSSKFPSKSDLSQPVQGSYPPNAAALRQLPDGIGSAPKGHFIVSAHTYDRSTLTYGKYPVSYAGTTGKVEALSATVPAGLTSPSYPTACAAFAGRMFYGGFSGELANTILYSQIVGADRTKLDKCYQDNDPTDPEVNQVLATDGGSIVLEGCGRIMQMEAVGNGLVVLATNGVWAISGGDRSFSPTNTYVSKLSSDGVVGKHTAVAIPGGLLYMAKAGIYSVSSDPAVGTLSASNISRDTIQTYYISSITGASKQYARGAFDPYNQRVQWLYHKADTYDSSTKYWEYNAALVLDVRLGAFYPIEYSSGASLIAGHAAPVSSTVVSTSQVTETDGTVVTTTLGVPITVADEYYSSSFSGLKYSCLYYDAGAGTYKLSFAELNNRDMVDWAALGENTEYSCYVEAGDDTVGDPSRMKDALVLVMWFEITEDAVVDTGGGVLDYDHKSGCTLLTKWEWTDDAGANRFHDVGQVYELPVTYTPSGVEDVDTFNYGYTVATVKRSIFGSGRAVRLRFTADAGKDMRLLGYSLVLTVEEHI